MLLKCITIVKIQNDFHWFPEGDYILTALWEVAFWQCTMLYDTVAHDALWHNVGLPLQMVDGKTQVAVAARTCQP